MDHKAIALEWFQYAEMDFEAAKFLQTMKPVPLEIICYHCQQSAEKYLKGFIALNGGEVQKTHDLVSLNKICTNYHSEFVQLLDDCINLTDYGVQESGKLRCGFAMNRIVNRNGQARMDICSFVFFIVQIPKTNGDLRYADLFCYRFTGVGACFGGGNRGSTHGCRIGTYGKGQGLL